MQEDSVFDDPNITLFAYVFVIGGIVVALVWFLMVVPAERRYHERKLQAVQEKIRRREETIINDGNETSSEAENSDS